MYNWNFKPVEVSDSVQKVWLIKKNSAREYAYCFCNLGFFFAFISLISLIFHYIWLYFNGGDYGNVVIVYLIFLFVSVFLGIVSLRKKRKFLKSARSMLENYWDWLLVSGKLLALEDLEDDARNGRVSVETFAVEFNNLLDGESNGRENEVDGQSQVSKR